MSTLPTADGVTVRSPFFNAARERAMLRRWVQSLRAWGWPALAGVALLLAGGALATWQVPRLHQAQAQAEAQLRQARAAARAARAVQAAAPAEPGDARQRFVDGFPPAAQRQQRLGALWALARSHGLAVRRSEFRAVADASLGLARYRITLPLEGAYPALRGFIEQALLQDPALSLDRLRLDRPDATSPGLRAELQLSLWSRMAGGPR